MSLLLLFAGTSGRTPWSRGGGWLTPEQAAAQLRELKRQEKVEGDRRARVLKKAQDLEEAIADAYSISTTGKPRLRKAMESVEAPEEFTPETIFQVGKEVAGKMAGALGGGRRFSKERQQLEQLERALEDFQREVQAQELARYRRNRMVATLLLMAAL